MSEEEVRHMIETALQEERMRISMIFLGEAALLEAGHTDAAARTLASTLRRIEKAVAQ